MKSLSRFRPCDPVDCSLPGFSVHGILQARILEWVTISFSTSIITLNVNRLTHQPKDTEWLGGWKRVHISTSIYHITLLTPQTACDYFYFRLITFPLWPAIVIIFYFLSGYWKLMNIFYYCDYVTITHSIPLHDGWATEK